MTTDATKMEPRESSAILAGLRMLQAWREGRVASNEAEHDLHIDDIETGGGSHDPLSADEIDALCERVNCGELMLEEG